MDNTDRVSRESTSSSGGFIWPWNDITTRRFQGNRSICLRTDAAGMVYDRSHHMCQNLICQQLKWQRISPDLFPRTLFAAGIVCVAPPHYIHAGITFQGSARFFSRQREARAFGAWPWRVRATFADEPNVTRRVSGITPWMGEFNHHIINGFGLKPVIHDSVLYRWGSTCWNKKVVDILCAAISSTVVD